MNVIDRAVCAHCVAALSEAVRGLYMGVKVNGQYVDRPSIEQIIEKLQGGDSVSIGNADVGIFLAVTMVDNTAVCAMHAAVLLERNPSGYQHPYGRRR